MIEERRTHFERMCHAHAIRLIQNIVGKKVSLIEPQIRSQIVWFLAAAAQFAKNAVESRRQFRTQKRRFVRLRESSIPIDVSAIRSQQRAFEESFQFVFKANLVVGY